MTRILLSLLIGLWGGATMFAMAGDLTSDFGPAIAAALGATFAGAITAPLFVRKEWPWDVLGAIGSTTLGAAFVGAYVGFPGDLVFGLTAAPLMLWSAILQSPAVLAVWLVGAATVTLAARFLARLSRVNA